MPWERWTEKEARKRPQAVGWVVGETTYLPMEMAVCEMGNIQDRRLEMAGVSIKGRGGLQLYRPTGRQRSQKAACGEGLAPLGRRCVGCNRANYNSKFI